MIINLLPESDDLMTQNLIKLTFWIALYKNILILREHTDLLLVSKQRNINKIYYVASKKKQKWREIQYPKEMEYWGMGYGRCKFF